MVIIDGSRNFAALSRYALAGIAVGVVAYLIAFLATMLLAPRLQENVRSVVALPWPLYASIPSVVAAILGIVTGTLVSRGRQRLTFWICVGTTIALCSSLGIELLRRDFAGKL